MMTTMTMTALETEVRAAQDDNLREANRALTAMLEAGEADLGDPATYTKLAREIADLQRAIAAGGELFDGFDSTLCEKVCDIMAENGDGYRHVHYLDLVRYPLRRVEVQIEGYILATPGYADDATCHAMYAAWERAKAHVLVAVSLAELADFGFDY